MKERGFFLPETVLLGAMLLAAASVWSIFGTAEQQLLQNEAAVTAVFLAQEQLARVEALPKSEISSASTLARLGGENPTKLNGKSFTVTTEVSPSEDVRFRKVSVKVWWTQGKKVLKKSYQKLVSCHE